MVDTPRTLAQVKTLLANNNSGEISPQDLRDVIESIIDPIIGGGFDPTPKHAARWTGGPGAAIPIVDDSRVAIKLVVADGDNPDGLFTDEPAYVTYTGITVPQGSLLRLTPGWWDWFVSLAWGGASLVEGADYSVGLTYAADPINLDPFYQYGYWNSMTMYTNPHTPSSIKYHERIGKIRVPSLDMSGNPVTSFPFFAGVSLNHQGSNFIQSWGQVSVVRVGNA